VAIISFVQENIDAEVVAMVNLDVQRAFDAAWWPGVLTELRECRCPKNFYELTKSYFTQRIAALLLKSLRTEKALSRGCP